MNLIKKAFFQMRNSKICLKQQSKNTVKSFLFVEHFYFAYLVSYNPRNIYSLRIFNIIWKPQCDIDSFTGVYQIPENHKHVHRRQTTKFSATELNDFTVKKIKQKCKKNQIN